MYNGTQVIRTITDKITAFLGSRRFFYGVLVFLAVESVWVAVSARYPMAFDEDFHVGIIKIYSHHWLPFLAAQPDNANQFGGLARDPSYLYHYLMSFPYRLVAAMTDNQMAQIIVLRLLNIPLVVWAMVLFRRVLRRAGTSQPLAQTAIALFVLIPIVPLLAGQINYDNLLLPLVAWMCLLTFDVYTAARERRIPLATWALLAVVCLLTSLVKYAFLPMAAAMLAFVAVGLWRGFYGHGRAFLAACRQGFAGTSLRLRWLLVVAVILSAGLFVQRYGVNTVQYHTPIPACDAVLDETACRAYGPWLRNYELEAAKANAGQVAETHPSPIAYTWQWLQSLHYRLFFSVNGPYDDFRNFPPMPIPSATAILLAVSGLVAVVLCCRQLFAGYPLIAFLASLAFVYAAALWLEDYSQFVETGQPVAINGRYLLPILLPLAAVFGRAFHIVLAQLPRVKVYAAAIALVLFLQGGGVSSFILRSDALWYWEQPGIVHMNEAAQRVLSPLIIEGPKYYQ